MGTNAQHKKIRPRVLFYSHDGIGLGHFRITLAVAEALARKIPKAARLLLTGLPAPTEFKLPKSLDYVRMPGLDKRKLFEGDPDGEAGAPSSVFTLRKALIAATIDGFAPHLVVVDHNPAGLAGELLPVLNGAYQGRIRPKFVLGMRDITYGPERTRKEWDRTGSFELLETAYDLILVYGSPLVFDPIQEYGLPPEVAAKTIFTGYFRRPEPMRSPRAIREELGALETPLVVVSAGGGFDGAGLLARFLEAVQRGLLPHIISVVVAGPQMPKGNFAHLKGLAAPLPNVRLARFHQNLESLVASADAVVTMGGYNSVWEAVGAGKRPIIVPRQGGSDEQPIRAERLHALGLATMVIAETLTPESLAAAVRAELARSVTPAVTLDFEGLDRAGTALASLLGR